jgi:general stress protein CsbA
MLELKIGQQAFFLFSNRVPREDASGNVRLYRVPQKIMLTAGRYVDLLVLLTLIFAQFQPDKKYQIAVWMFAVQALHLLIKTATYWRPCKVPAARLTSTHGARVTLQSEHSGFLISASMILNTLITHASFVIEYLCLFGLVCTIVSLVISRPLLKQLPTEW